MEKGVKYPTAERIIEYNLLVLTIIKAKRKDKAQVLNHQKLRGIIGGCEKLEGDIYDKAVYLLKNLIKQHPFASGNRRTAFVVVKEFLLENGEKFKIKDDPEQAKVMLGIRENYYTDNEIKEWIKNGEIRIFKRFER